MDSDRSLAGFTTIVFFWVGVLPTLRQGAGVRPAVWTWLAIYGALVGTAAVLAYALWRSGPLSRRTLRTTEVAGLVPGNLQAIVLRCLSESPDDRYQSAEALDDALARCASSRP